MKGKIATANRLREGDIVYLTKTGEWSLNMQDAWFVEGDGKNLIVTAQASVEERVVVETYLIEVDCVDGEIHALSQRERIRATGPTV